MAEPTRSAGAATGSFRLARIAGIERELASGRSGQLPVVRDGRAIGIVRRADVMRALVLRDELGIELDGRNRGGRAA